MKQTAMMTAAFVLVAAIAGAVNLWGMQEECCGPTAANPEACLDLYVGPAEDYQSEQQDAYVDAMSQTPPDLEAAAEAGSNLEQIGAYLDGLGGGCGTYDDTEWNSGADLLSLCESGLDTYEKCQEETPVESDYSVLVLD